MLKKITTALGVRKKDARVLVVGLDYAGKSTILNTLKPDETRATGVSATLAMQEETFTTKHFHWRAVDTSGNVRYRSLWEKHINDCDAIIFVVDSSDALRMVVACDELWLLLSPPEVQSGTLPLLVMANKADDRHAMGAMEVSQALGLERMRGRATHICGTNALTGAGVLDGLDWLASAIAHNMEHHKLSNK